VQVEETELKITWTPRYFFGLIMKIDELLHRNMQNVCSVIFCDTYKIYMNDYFRHGLLQRRSKVSLFDFSIIVIIYS
jgi:hypothetical protein